VIVGYAAQSIYDLDMFPNGGPKHLVKKKNGVERSKPNRGYFLQQTYNVPYRQVEALQQPLSDTSGVAMGFIDHLVGACQVR
jgi:hypothetical protein